MVLPIYAQQDSQWAARMCFKRKFPLFLVEIEKRFLTTRLFTTLTKLTRLLTRKNTCTFKNVTHFSSVWVTYSPVMNSNILLYTWQRYLLSTDLAVWGVGLRPNACWDCGFESRQEHGCLSVANVVCCQVEVSASDWSLVQRSPADCGVSEYDHETSTVRRPWPTGGCCPMVKRYTLSSGQCVNHWRGKERIVHGLCCSACRDRRNMTQDFSQDLGGVSSPLYVN